MKIRKVRILLVLILIFIFPQMVHASGKSIEATLPVEQVFEIEGEKPEKLNTSVSYVLKRISPSYPLPVSSEGDEYRFTMVGEKAKELLKWTFDKPGIYEYDIYADMHDQNKYFYDHEHYRIKIAINELTSGRWAPTQVVVINKEGKKPDKLVFKHRLEFRKDIEAHRKPMTGDITNINLWIAIAIISMLMCVYLMVKSSREKNQKQ